ncbi:Protein YiiM [Flavobacteriales bacterium]|nr:Protein YiiM [Flavobacteriales bacterium]MCL4817046.1 MOSC domain-containing protein [Flavobacteriales bacterium]WKZ76091.1 MAG: MOSC domain-containing protein [Vicingaceae bacterium]GIK70527.1 MAG: MOSC domain-containing protein [Bacteroidota bacterium]CAG0986728.1 Protein YiiM [Flavobacteriales bacterium]
MKVLSVNISKPQTITVNGKEEQTGYFKNPVKRIYLGKTDVKDDSVTDREHHGGEDKACYLYGFNHYEFWKSKYPQTTFNFGMFGENITVEYIDESTLRIGDTFEIGKAIIQITQPRQPCYKMGIKFNNQKVVNEFRLSNFPGIYVRVLKEGEVKTNDELKLIERDNTSPTVLEVYRLIYESKPNQEKLYQLVENKFIADSLKKYIVKKYSL